MKYYNQQELGKRIRHAKEIITVDVYGDKKELIGDCLDVLEPFIAEVIPKDSENNTCELINMMSLSRNCLMKKKKK